MAPTPYAKIKDIPTRALYQVRNVIEEAHDGRHPGRTLEQVVDQQLYDQHQLRLSTKDLKTLIYCLTLRVDEIKP